MRDSEYGRLPNDALVALFAPSTELQRPLCFAYVVCARWLPFSVILIPHNSTTYALRATQKAEELKYSTNVVVTSKYKWWNFLPINMFEQFKKVANFYFLIIAILQMIPGKQCLR